MALDIAVTNGNEFGDFTDREVRTLIYELASEMYRPAHEAFLAAFAEELNARVKNKNRTPSPNGPTKSDPAPTFDDSPLVPVWVACLNRAKTHVIDMLQLKTDFDVPAIALQGEGNSAVASSHAKSLVDVQQADFAQ